MNPTDIDIADLARRLWDFVEFHPGWVGAPIHPRRWDEVEPWFMAIQVDLARYVAAMVELGRVDIDPSQAPAAACPLCGSRKAGSRLGWIQVRAHEVCRHPWHDAAKEVRP